MFETRITRSYTMSAAHRLEGHPKCGRLHGHNYKIEVSLTSAALENGMVLDFGDLDKVVNRLLSDLDHRYLVSLENVENECPYYKAIISSSTDILNHMAIHPIERTTAELIAQYFYDSLTADLKYGQLFRVIGGAIIRVWETDRSCATYHGVS